MEASINLASTSRAGLKNSSYSSEAKKQKSKKAKFLHHYFHSKIRATNYILL